MITLSGVTGDDPEKKNENEKKDNDHGHEMFSPMIDEPPRDFIIFPRLR